MMKKHENFARSEKLAHVRYNIRGAVLDEALRLESGGVHITKLNIGNPAAFGFNASADMLEKVKRRLPDAQGYINSKGLIPAREAIMQYYHTKGFSHVRIDDIYMGNGVSELIVMVMQALLNSGDEVLIPKPDYPLWTAAAHLAGGTPVHYRCDEQADWNPDIADIRAKVNSRTRAIVVITPNNPTGAVYSQDIIEELHDIADENGLMVFADEIYEKIVYDDNHHVSIADYCKNIPCIIFNGLSKAYLAAGFRTGWMVLSGNISLLKDYRAGLDVLSSMRLCANAPTQFAVSAALNGHQDIDDLVLPGGRLKEQRDMVYQCLNTIPGVSVGKPRGSLYAFPRINAKKMNILDDTRFVYDLLVKKHILVVEGSGFNWHAPNHFRIVFLPNVQVLSAAVTAIGEFLEDYQQEQAVG